MDQPTSPSAAALSSARAPKIVQAMVGAIFATIKCRPPLLTLNLVRCQFNAKLERLLMMLPVFGVRQPTRPPLRGLVLCLCPLQLRPSLAEGRFFCTEIDCVVADTDGGRSVAVTMVPAAVHEALGVVARGYAAQLNNFSAGTIRGIGHNEVHE